MSNHIGSQGAFLASLPRSDPERIAAEAHAADCPTCRAALDEGEQLVRLIAEAMPSPPPRPAQLEKTAALIEAEISRERRSERALGAVVAGAVAFSWIFQISLDLSTAATAPRRVIVSLSVLGVALVAVVVAKNRRWLASAALIGASGLLAQAAGSVAALEPKIGAQCTLWEIVAAAIPWTVALLVARKWSAAFSRSNMVTIAGAGALASQAAQHLTCPVWHADAHLLIFHFGGVLLAMLLGALGHSAQAKVSSA